MNCTTATGFSFKRQNPALRRYSQRFSVAMGAYVIAILVAIGHYLREEKDEFLRAIQTEALLWGCGVTLAVATSWGFLQMFTDVPRAPLYLIFALFCFVWGVAAAVIPRRYL